MTKKPFIIYCDLDGVLAAMIPAACARFGVELPKQSILDNQWGYNACAGGSRTKFWMTIHGHDFWSNEIQPYWWAKKLLSVVEKESDEWVFLSKPATDVGCMSGKYRWVQKHFHATNHLVLTLAPKSLLCPGFNGLLIDDNLKNCKMWEEAGGAFFHWPEMTPDMPEGIIHEYLEQLKQTCQNQKTLIQLT